MYVEVFKYVMNEKQFSTTEDADYKITYEKNGQKMTCSFGRTNTHAVIKMRTDYYNDSISINITDYLSKNTTTK
jgi:hypothetical protein